MPAWVKDEKAWNQAKEAAREAHLSEKDGSDYWRYVAGVYKKMSHYKKGWEDYKDEIEEYRKRNNLSPQLHPNVILTDMLEKAKGWKKNPDQENTYVKGEHATPEEKKKVARMYRNDPTKWSVRSLAEHEGMSKHAVADVVKTLPSSSKTSEHVQEKQSKHARWAGKKLPSHMVRAVHKGRNIAIENRPETSMEKPVNRLLKEMGIAFKTQVDVGQLVSSDDPELGIVDFYIPSKKIIINADGGRHRLANVKARITKQDKLLRSHGYRVVHVTDVEMSQGKMKEIIRGALHED